MTKTKLPQNYLLLYVCVIFQVFRSHMITFYVEKTIIVFFMHIKSSSKFEHSKTPI